MSPRRRRAGSRFDKGRWIGAHFLLFFIHLHRRFRGNGAAYAALPATLTRGDVYYVADGSYGAIRSTTPLPALWTTVKKVTVADNGTATGLERRVRLRVGGVHGPHLLHLLLGLSMASRGGGLGSWKTGFGFKINYSTSSPGVSVLGVTGITLRHIAVIGPHINGSGGTASTDAFSAIPIASVAGSRFLAEYVYIGGFYGTAVASIWVFAGR